MTLWIKREPTVNSAAVCDGSKLLFDINSFVRASWLRSRTYSNSESAMEWKSTRSSLVTVLWRHSNRVVRDSLLIQCEIMTIEERKRKTLHCSKSRRARHPRTVDASQHYSVSQQQQPAQRIEKKKRMWIKQKWRLLDRDRRCVFEVIHIFFSMRDFFSSRSLPITKLS